MTDTDRTNKVNVSDLKRHASSLKRALRKAKAKKERMLTLMNEIVNMQNELHVVSRDNLDMQKSLYTMGVQSTLNDFTSEYPRERITPSVSRKVKVTRSNSDDDSNESNEYDLLHAMFDDGE